MVFRSMLVVLGEESVTRRAWQDLDWIYTEFYFIVLSIIIHEVSFSQFFAYLPRTF